MINKEQIESIVMTFTLVVAFPAILIGVFACLNYIPTLFYTDTYETSMEWPLGGCLPQDVSPVTPVTPDKTLITLQTN
ncbi:MAG: hypothetical protein KAH77_00210 [Thiomargarita sp.]|nr:hypothetical protein [Thiomargarita sp.]